MNACVTDWWWSRGRATLSILRRRHVQPIVSAPNRNDFDNDSGAERPFVLRYSDFSQRFFSGHYILPILPSSTPWNQDVGRRFR